MEITYAVRKPSIGPFVPIPRHHTSLRGGRAESGDMVKRRTLAEIKFTMFALLVPNAFYHFTNTIPKEASPFTSSPPLSDYILHPPSA